MRWSKEHAWKPPSLRSHSRACLELNSLLARGRARSRPYNPQDLALAPGTRLGVYEVAAQIGEGGMGLVYRARDTKLNRDVALKILPDAFASDADRLARFPAKRKRWRP